LRAGTGAAKEAGMEEHAPKRKKWVVAALLILPVWLLASGGVGIWLHFKHQAEEDKKEVARYATMVSQESLADDLRKLTQTIGERNTRAADGNGLTRAAAWLEGTLGPSNTGYALKRARGPADERWPLLRATLRGSDPKAKPLWVVAAYDSPVGSPGIESGGTAVVAAVAAAQAMAGEKPRRAVHFVFLPHGYESAELAERAAGGLKEWIAGEGEPLAVLCLDAMGAGESLRVSAPAGENPVLENLGKLAVRVPFAPGDRLTDACAAAGLPAVRVAAREPAKTDEKDAGTPSGGRLAGTTGLMVEWLRRVAMQP